MRVAFAAASFALGSHALALEKNRPVSKVINLLKDMKTQLETEAEQDQEVYDKLQCWCTTNDKEKTQAIKDAEDMISSLTAAIESSTATSARLNTEIANLNKEVAANQAALEKATALRQKQLAEFNAEEKDLLQSISAMKNAVVVLSKHHENFLQTDLELTNINIASLLKRTMKVHRNLLEDSMTPSQQKTVKAFIEGPSHLAGYESQSGEIFGILKNMLDTFKANLSSSQKDEMANQKAYEDLKAAKEDEINAGQAQIDTKTDELAASDEKLVNDKAALEETRESLDADTKFLMMLKEKCTQTDQEWEARQKTRAEEIAGVNKALEILSSDDSHDMFTKTFNASFLQLSDRRSIASKVLASAAKKLSSPRLSTLATSVRLDAFTKVKKAIDDMVAALLKEKADEIKHKDFCVDAFNKNDKAQTKTTRDLEDNETKINQLTAQIEKLDNEIRTLKDEIVEANTMLKRAGEDREKENSDFQQIVSDQRATQKLLNQANAALKSFYEKAALMQTSQEPAGPPPPAGFKSYENNAGGSGVIAMITQIIQDAKAMEAKAIHDEEDAQATYEAIVKDTNNIITGKNKAIVEKSAEKGTAEENKVAEEQARDNNQTSLEQLGNENHDLHKSCDYVQKNFEVRQEARDQEVEALRQAKSILSGSDQSL